MVLQCVASCTAADEQSDEEENTQSAANRGRVAALAAKFGGVAGKTAGRRYASFL